MELQTFETTEHDSQDMEYNIDLEMTFSLTSMTIAAVTQMNSSTTPSRQIRYCHFNSRSLYANFHNIKNYLHQFAEPFVILAISETWINPVKGTDFKLDGYEMNHININRENKTGGGVAVYVDKNLNFMVEERQL